MNDLTRDWTQPDGLFMKGNLEYELNNYFKKLQYFKQVGLDQADQLLELNRAKFEIEDIDYTEYTQKADEAFRIQLDYLETLNNYNQTAIQLEFYAY
jgi:cobalt-zinc-cadmium resistance protein CzcA